MLILINFVEKKLLLFIILEFGFEFFENFMIVLLFIMKIVKIIILIDDNNRVLFYEWGVLVFMIVVSIGINVYLMEICLVFYVFGFVINVIIKIFMSVVK